MGILNTTIVNNKRALNSYFKCALWADRMTEKRTTGKAPFELVYGVEAVLPIHLQMPE
jgi:hypothetical protein